MELAQEAINGQRIESTTDAALFGISGLLQSGDIAILALTTCLLLALIGNIVQYYVGNHRQQKDFDRYLAVVESLKDLTGALNSVKDILLIIQSGGKK